MVVGQSFVSCESKLLSFPSGAMESIVCPNPFLNLDEGTEYQILDRVNSPRDLAAVMVVCKRWKRLGEHAFFVIQCLAKIIHAVEASIYQISVRFACY